jgi:hypothetical protein
MFFRKQAITVELVGGIGNQLFGYFAGVYLANNLERDLVLDFRNSVDSHTQLKVDINSLVLAYSHTAILGKSSPLRFFRRRVSDKIRHESAFLGRIISRMSHEYLDEMTEGGMNLSILDNLRNRGHVRIRGYFNSFEYFYKLPDSYRTVSISNGSEQFHKLCDELDQCGAVAMHIRRGDYVGNSETYGLLSNDYYQEALKLMMELKPFAPVWVFSDDHEAAIEISGEITGIDFRLLTINELENPLEALILMSKAKGHVIANSTFSQWAAVLGNSPIVICPKEYFADGRTNQEYPPKNWIPIKSKWE